MASKKKVSSDWAFPKSDPEQIAEVTKKQGGATVDMTTGKLMETGTYVSVPGHEKRVPAEGLSAEEIKKYSSNPETVSALTENAERKLGTWIDTDEKGRPTAFMDVSQGFPNTPVGNKNARLAMLANQQFAGFNLDTFQSEYNPVQESVLGRAGGAPELQEGEAERWVNSTKPIGEEIVYAWTTEPQQISQGRGRRKHVIPANQGTFIFTGDSGQMSPPKK